MSENPEWRSFSCQKCVIELPYLKQMITFGAEKVIGIVCEHKQINEKVKG